MFVNSSIQITLTPFTRSFLLVYHLLFIIARLFVCYYHLLSFISFKYKFMCSFNFFFISIYFFLFEVNLLFIFLSFVSKSIFLTKPVMSGFYSQSQ